MAQRTDQPRPVVATALIGGAAVWACRTSGPILYGAQVNIVSAGAALIAAGCGLSLIGRTLGAVGTMFDWLAARKPTGLKGTADFIQNVSELGDDLKRKGWAPYWGSFNGEALFVDYESVAMTVGSSGSGKSVGVVEPNALAIRGSKIIPDFKGNLTVKLIEALRARGERVRVLNFADIYTDILGETDQLNPLCVMTDAYQRAGGLLQVGEIYREAALQLYPEPNSANDANGYFRKGSRNLIHFAMETCILVQGEEATLGDVLAMLNDRDSLLKHAQWACGQLELAPTAPSQTPNTESDDVLYS